VWPTPIVAVGPDAEAALPYPAASFEKDFAWTPNHPLVDAYRAAHEERDVLAPALAAVLHAARPNAALFRLSEPGALHLSDDGRLRFTPSAAGKHRTLLPDPEQKDRVIQAYIELVSARPNRQPRPRRAGQ
jgi:hypothetical protein